MQENTLKMASIRSGDVVGYINGIGKVSHREVEGFRDVPGRRLVMLAGGVHISVDQVLERRRDKGCGKGTIVFEQEAS